jgi:hypothetical protein
MMVESLNSKLSTYTEQLTDRVTEQAKVEKKIFFFHFFESKLEK